MAWPTLMRLCPSALMEPSPIEVRVFRKVEEAAQWLGVPVVALRAES